MLEIDVEMSSAFEVASRHVLMELGEREANVKTLLRRLCETGGGKMERLLFEEGKESVSPGLMVMVNDRVFTGTVLNQEVVELHDKDKVSLLYFVSGG